jgi:hypothetical protein
VDMESKIRIQMTFLDSRNKFILVFVVVFVLKRTDNIELSNVGHDNMYVRNKLPTREVNG